MASEHCFLLIFQRNFYLVVARVAVKEAVEEFPFQRIQYLINEWQGKMIILGCHI